MWELVYVLKQDNESSNPLDERNTKHEKSSSLSQYRAEVAYWGTNFSGFQSQKNQKLIFKVGQETENVERKIVPFTPSKNPYKERLLLVAVGNYLIEAYKERENGRYNFSLGILVGDSCTWHAEGLKENIIERFGEDAYQEWKEIVRETRWQAKMCVALARMLTNKIIGSEVCFESSRRFCKQVGLFVSEDEAFLIPEKYQY